MSKVGRPTKYNPKICDRLPSMFENGESVAEVCKELGISKQTFYRWEEEHTEFSDAKKEGIGRSEAWWNRLGREGASGEHAINPTVWIFNMKNRFGWRDKQDIEHSGGVKIAYLDRDDADL